MLTWKSAHFGPPAQPDRKLPDNVKELIGTNAEGPNCYWAMQAFFEGWNLEDYKFFVDSNAVDRWLETYTHYCEEKVVPAYGVIREYRCSECGTVSHVAVYVGPDALFHKPGTAWIRGFEVTTVEEVDRIYKKLFCSYCGARDGIVISLRRYDK